MSVNDVDEYTDTFRCRLSLKLYGGANLTEVREDSNTIKAVLSLFERKPDSLIDSTVKDTHNPSNRRNYKNVCIRTEQRKQATNAHKSC